MPGQVEKLILGIDFAIKNKMLIDFKERILKIDERYAR